MTGLFSDPRRRNLAVLAAVAVISVVLAVVALDERAAEVAPKYPPHEFFPGLAGKVNEVTRIHIVSQKGGAFDVAFVPMKGWVLPARTNYPASFEEVRKTLVGMAALETIEPKTARPDWFHYVDLDAPPKGRGVEITLMNDKGTVLARLIGGKTEDIGDTSGANGLFVRKPGDNQSWLVRSPFTVRATPSEWLDKKVVDVDRARIKEADVRPSSGPAYVVSRDKPSDADFDLNPIPKGRELAYPGSPDAVASAIADFSFDDIRPAGGFDFTNASRLITKTFDGLIVTTDVVKQGNDYWARIFADAAPGKPDAAKEAQAINAHADGWAFKLDQYKGAEFGTTLESLLKAKK
jgi:Domain of unknown function (DUF4340)